MVKSPHRIRSEGITWTQRISKKGSTFVNAIIVCGGDGVGLTSRMCIMTLNFHGPRSVTLDHLAFNRSVLRCTPWPNDSVQDTGIVIHHTEQTS